MALPAAKENETAAEAGDSNRRLVRPLLLAGLLLLVLWLGLEGWRLFTIARSLQARQAQAEALAEAGMSELDPEAVEDLVFGLRGDVVALKHEVGPFLPLAPLFSWLPRVGPLFEEARPLLEMADAGTAAAAYAVRGLKPALVILQSDEDNDQDLLPALLPVLEEARPDLVAAAASMDRVLAARAEIENVEAMPGQVRSLLELMDDKLFLADTLRVAPALPALMGSDGPRTYLIMAQNEDELRPTGGFLTGAGLLTVENGEISSLSFQDANLVDAWAERQVLTKPYDEPPRPLYEYMGLELFLFRDANFWPDFPTSAEQAMALYSYGQDLPPLDGAIAIDQQFISMLLRATGPLQISDLELTVNSGNVVEGLRSAWQIDEGQNPGEWVSGRKDFFGPFAEAVKDRLLGDFGSLDPLYLAATLDEAFREKHLQVYVRDPAVAVRLAEAGWDGRLRRQDGRDSLMVVDSNLGYNKVNALVSRALRYEVALTEAGDGTADLLLQYDHLGEKSAEPCHQDMPYREAAADYSILMRGCYWNYLRVYAPPGSELLEASSHHVSPQTTVGGRGWSDGAQLVDTGLTPMTVFGNYFLLPSGESLESYYRYRLPQVVQEVDGERVYELQLLKQAGTAGQQVELRITLPPGSQLLDTVPAATRVEDQTVIYQVEQQTDLTFTVAYEGAQ